MDTKRTLKELRCYLAQASSQLLPQTVATLLDDTNAASARSATPARSTSSSAPTKPWLLSSREAEKLLAFRKALLAQGLPTALHRTDPLRLRARRGAESDRGAADGKTSPGAATAMGSRRPCVGCGTLHRWCCWGQVLEASKVSMVQRAAPLRAILASLVISGTPRLSARAT